MSAWVCGNTNDRLIWLFSQSKKAGHYTYKLQTLGSKLLTAKEIQMMLQEAQFLNNSSVVRFSAMNFFNLDYSMLCGVSDSHAAGEEG